jgi:hypothetical protein
MQIALFVYATMIIYRLKVISYIEFMSIIFKNIKFCSPKLLRRHTDGLREEMPGYLDEIFHVGGERGDLSPVVLGVVPVLLDERRRVHKEEIGDTFHQQQRNKNCPGCKDSVLEKMVAC